jgi:tetrahydromethanopterin S-methyltransferase subunit G
VSQTQTPLSFEDGEPFPEGLSDESEIDKLIRENRLDEIEPEVDYTDEFRMMGLIE